MKKLIIGSAIAALTLAIPAAAPAQRLGQAVIAVVDLDRLLSQCTACQTASSQIGTQLQGLQTRRQQLAQPLTTEGQSIQASVRALNGRQPDAALQARITAFQQRENTANQELARTQQTIESTRAHVNQQLNARLGPIFNAVLQSRNATVILDKGSTLASSASVDVTADVLTQLNQQLPTVSVTPLPQQAQPAQPQQPQGR